mmetsp:Transcript_18526/g.36894  ORF Transcript_18526/g.36894 Transcript_18526/m.36894 type:complete len:227 (+) Transcript_18526:945-1625(+)
MAYLLATASPDLFVDYFRNGEVRIETKVVHIPRQTFLVKINWLFDCEVVAGTNMKGGSRRVESGAYDDDRLPLSPWATEKIDFSFLCKLTAALLHQQPPASPDDTYGAAILVFLPGKGEISALHRAMRDEPALGQRHDCTILSLHSEVPRSQVKEVFTPARRGTVKIILATNIVKTSVTISDVSVVIDTGRVKESRYSPATKVRELVSVFISRASTTQRSGCARRI